MSLKKELNNEVNFLHADKHEACYKLILMGMVMHSQSCQNSKFAMFLQYLRKEVQDEVGFLHADKHQSFRKV